MADPTPPRTRGSHTSLFSLVIGQHDLFRMGNAQKRIVEAQSDSRLTFRFQHWTKKTDDGFATLERFLRRVGWFVTYRTTDIANPS